MMFDIKRAIVEFIGTYSLVLIFLPILFVKYFVIGIMAASTTNIVKANLN